MPVGEGMTQIEFRDIASGKFARGFGGAYDILLNDPSSKRRPSRAIAVSSGACTYTGTDGVDVTLPDMGGAWQWDIQAIAIISGSGAVIW